MIQLISKILIFSTLWIPIFLHGQESSDSTVENSHKNSIFIELLGANGYFSINYDREIKTIKKIHFRAGLGVGYINYEEHTPQLLSAVLRVDLLYGNKIIKPVIGYAFSYVDDLDTYYNNNNRILAPDIEDIEEVKNYYLVHALNVGVAVKIWRMEMVPKYYLLLIDRSDYNRIITVHWVGLQIKFNF